MCTTFPVAAEDTGADNIPYGVEALIDYKSEHTYRGFILAQDTIDLQLSAQYAFNNTTYLNSALWHNTAAGDEDFSETGILAALNKDINQWTLSLSGEYRSYSDSFFESGVNIQAAAIFQLNRAIDFSGRVAYDTGAEGWYSDIECLYYIRLNDDSFLQLSGGVSAVSDYYTRDGFNDLFAKISYTYNINNSISLTPYAGTSILLDSDDQQSDSLYGGINFAVSF